jgi:hypothetical protein
MPKDLNRFIEEEDVVAAALEAGFAMSTAYGQEQPKLMPISDRATLESFARKIQERVLAQIAEKAKDAVRACPSPRVAPNDPASQFHEAKTIYRIDAMDAIDRLLTPEDPEEERLMTCSSCKKSKKDVSYRECGYSKEINGTVQMEEICDSCENQHLGDI